MTLATSGWAPCSNARRSRESPNGVRRARPEVRRVRGAMATKGPRTLAHRTAQRLAEAVCGYLRSARIARTFDARRRGLFQGARLASRFTAAPFLERAWGGAGGVALACSEVVRFGSGRACLRSSLRPVLRRAQRVKTPLPPTTRDVCFTSRVESPSATGLLWFGFHKYRWYGASAQMPGGVLLRQPTLPRGRREPSGSRI